MSPWYFIENVEQLFFSSSSDEFFELIFSSRNLQCNLFSYLEYVGWSQCVCIVSIQTHESIQETE